MAKFMFERGFYYGKDNGVKVLQRVAQKGKKHIFIKT